MKGFECDSVSHLACQLECNESQAIKLSTSGLNEEKEEEEEEMEEEKLQACF